MRSLRQLCLDFYQGLVPMLEGRSEGIPSWDRDDDFLLENEAATSEEAPNFSLNLKALAEDLAKENLAKRLFIEPDLFPPELSGPDADVADSQVSEKRLTTFETFEELYSIYLADEKIAETEVANEDGTMSSLDDTRDFKTKDLPQLSQVTEQDTESKLDDAEREISHVTNQDSMLKFKNLAVRDAREPPIADDAGKQDTRPSSKFVADVAEAELDTLLNSFSDTRFSKSSATSINQEGTFMSFSKGNPVTHKAPLPHSPDAFSPPTKITSSLDDDLDDLLDASNLDKKGGLFQSIAVKTETTENECFLGLSRSVFPVSSCSLDDELDNLLEETSKPTEVKIGSSDFSSSSSSMSLRPGSKPKVLDDFDFMVGYIVIFDSEL